MLAQGLSRERAEKKRRLRFQSSLQIEAIGMERHDNRISKAFVSSYYELLQWLGNVDKEVTAQQECETES